MKIIPVIHMVNENRVRTNIKTVLECGLNSVFLINHQVSVEELIKCGLKMKEEFPSLWIGVNMLGVYIEDAVMYEFKFDGLWCDETMTEEIATNRRFIGQLFSGYDFKYQPKTKISVSEAGAYTNVLTTSGVGTGKETPLEKIEYIKQNTTTEIAIASGVNKHNIQNYKGLVDYILVASSITTRGEIILKDRLEELVVLS